MTSTGLISLLSLIIVNGYYYNLFWLYECPVKTGLLQFHGLSFLMKMIINNHINEYYRVARTVIEANKVRPIENLK